VNSGVLVLGGLALLALLIVLEGRRQRRRYGPGSGKGGSLMQAGMLDLQRHLEPQRKVEIRMHEAPRTEREAAADPPAPGVTPEASERGQGG
jgi:hypothetical protein